jgi:hypothetical protein
MISTVTFWLALTAASVAAAPEDTPSLQCEVGPLKKVYGGTPWLVYSCSDGASVVVVADEGNPALPFYFMLFAREGSYQLGGEGSRAKAVTDAAFEDLKHLTPDAIAALVRETQARSAAR